MLGLTLFGASAHHFRGPKQNIDTNQVALRILKGRSYPGVGVGFGLGVVLPARSSGAIANSKWQDQACVDSKTQIYARSLIVTVHNRTCTDKAMVERRVKVTRGEL